MAFIRGESFKYDLVYTLCGCACKCEKCLEWDKVDIGLKILNPLCCVLWSRRRPVPEIKKILNYDSRVTLT